jgi:hypothetical protein
VATITEEMRVAIRERRMVDPRYAVTAFVVEATDFEQLTLWQQWHETVTWQQDNPGWLETVGHNAGRPVCISVSWNVINGRHVMFYEATSQVVDHELVDAWLVANCNPKWDNGTRRAHTNAMNFGHCIHAVAPNTRVRSRR